MPTDKFLPIDECSGGRISIDSRHNAVHEGRMFGFHFENLTATATTVIDIHYRTGSEKIHIDVLRQALGGRVQTILYEKPTISTVGTSIITYKNRNRNFPDTNEMIIRSDTTFSSVGTIIGGPLHILSDATNQSKISSNIKDEVEWVLEPNTDYLARTTFIANTVYTMDGLFYNERHEEE